jgi:serine protease Do
MLLRNKAVLGAILDQQAAKATIDAVAPAGPADKAGLKKGDIIAAIGGKPVASASELVKLLGSYKPGDKLSAEVKRGEKTMKVSIELVASEKMAMPAGAMGAEKLSAMSSASGTLSKRKSDFPTALTHDIVLQAEQCGGPVVDLEGRAIGLNIARVDRTASYAIPASAVKSVIGELIPKSKPQAAKK